MLLLLTSAFTGIARAQYEQEPMEIEEETFYPEENYEAEMFLQKQDEMIYPSGADEADDYLAEEEVFEDQYEYNE